MSVDENVAISLLKRAVELDSKKRYTESLVCYKEGLNLILEVMKGLQDGQKKVAFRAKATEYMDRVELLTEQVDKMKKSGNFHEQIRIEADSVGHSYQSLFGRFLDEHVGVVYVEDPYVRSHHQIINFLRLCELLVKQCKALSEIHLTTSEEPSPGVRSEQVQKLTELRDDLKKRNINLNVKYSDTLHDREIRLNNGWQVKIGRGLDIFKAPKGKMTIGAFDQDLRPCHETVVDIFHKNTMISKR